MQDRSSRTPLSLERARVNTRFHREPDAVGHFTSLATFCVVVLGLAACQDASAPESLAQAQVAPMFAANSASADKRIPDEYIVVFENSAADVSGRAKGLLNAHGGSLRSTYTAALQGFAAHMSAQAAAAIANDPNVAYVEQEQVFEQAGVQDNASWGLDRIDQATLPLNGKYNYPGTGAGVNAYIIDSGIRRTNTEFGGRVVPAFSSAPDGLGPDGCQHWHGTHVAGIVGGAIYGVAKSVTLHMVRAYDCTGYGTTSSILSAVDWVTANRVRPAVALMSFSGAASLAVNSAVESSIGAGVTYVVAAGNNVKADACSYSPAGAAGAIAVAAISGEDYETKYTNVGPCVDLYAPGSQIAGPDVTSDVAISLYTGTSQAAAFVAGAAALYLQSNSGASPAQVADALVNGATSGVVLGLTAGTPNRLLRISGSGGSDPLPPPPPPPPPPTGNVAPVANFTATCNKASCSFDASSSTDDAGISNYGWNFGDGSSSSSSGSSMTHVYLAKGNYSMTVTLTATDAGGLTSTRQQSIAIRNKGR